MSYAELNQRISTHFTKEVLIDILERKSGLKNVEIKSIKIGAESKKGDSYLSTLCRFTVDATGVDQSGETENYFLPIITKAIPKNVARVKTFRSANFFETEIYFYEKIWPLMQQVKTANKVLDEPEVPLVLSSWSDGTNDYIAFEDLSYQQFVSIDRASGIDYEHTILLIKILAKFHALSIACKQQIPEYEQVAKAVKETYFAEEFRSWYIKFQKSLMKLTLVAVKQNLSEDYVKKVEKLFASDFFGTLCNLSKIHDSPLSVITQGDAWIPNFLVKYGPEKTLPIQSVLIDFQLARYTTLSNDLTFFLYSCVEIDILNKHWDDLLEEYYKAFNERVIQLGAKNPISLDDLKKDVQDHGIFGIGMTIEAGPMASLTDDEVCDLDAIQGEEAVPIENVWIMPEFDEARNKKFALVFKHAADKGFY